MRKFTLVAIVLLLALCLAACGPAKPKAADTNATTTPQTTETGGVSAVTESAPQPTAATGMTNTAPTIDPYPTVSPIIATPSASLTEILTAYDASKIVTTESGLQYIVYQEGEGTPASVGDTVKVHYSGYLPDGNQFDSSITRGIPLEFPVGRGSVIKGWDEGFTLLKPGSKAILIIPPTLGYGNQDNGQIPPNSTLYFDVELLEAIPMPVPSTVDTTKLISITGGLQYTDLVVGTGAEPKKGETVVMEFKIWDPEQQFVLGSSQAQMRPLAFPVQLDLVPAVFEEMVKGMKVGTKRYMWIAPDSELIGVFGLQSTSPGNHIGEMELTKIIAAPPEAPQKIDETSYVETNGGVKYADVQVGAGEVITNSEPLEVKFNVWAATDNKLISSSNFFGNETLNYSLGSGRFPGWDDGMVGMKMGGKRHIYVPAAAAGNVPGYEEPVDIVFEVEVIGAFPTPTPEATAAP